MNTLILSCNTGEGHNACARAIAEYYEIMESPCEIKDALAFVSETISKLVSEGHVLMYRKFSPLFGWGYEYARNHRETFDADSKLYHFFARGTDSLHEYIVENGFDQVICTHPFAAIMLTDLQRRCGLQTKTAFVATDYTCCPGAECSDLDLYFIPDEILADEFVQCGIPREKLRYSGIPIRQAFYTRTDRDEAKRIYEVDPLHRHIVMACGSMGCGPMEELSEQLTRILGSETELTVVCGTNEKLYSSMERMHGQNHMVHVRGFVENMPLLLDSADIYVTKPGGLSVSEAQAKGSYMILVNAVGGCETYNLRYLLQKGRGATGDNVEKLVQACKRTLDTPELFDGSQPEILNAAQYIYETMSKGSGNP